MAACRHTREPSRHCEPWLKLRPVVKLVVDRARLAVKPREMATKYRDTHHRGNSSRSQNSERVVRCSSTRRRQTRQYHGEVRLLESNPRHSLGVSICAQHERCPRKQNLGAIDYSGDKQTSATVGEASASKMEETESFKEDKLQLNLKKDSEGVYLCKGRIQGDYLVYLPDNEILTEKLVMHAHKLNCHGGVGLTMAKFREKY